MDSFGFKMILKWLFQKSDVKIHILFTEAEVAHFMLPRENVIYSYVVEKYENNANTITDFYSFYNLPSTIL